MDNLGLLSKLLVKASWRPFSFYLILFVFLGWATVTFLREGWNAIFYPYQLEYGEGAVLDQAIRLFNAQAIYRADLSTPLLIMLTLHKFPGSWINNPS